MVQRAPGCLAGVFGIGFIGLGLLTWLLFKLDLAMLTLVPVGIGVIWLLVGGMLLWRLNAARRPVAGPPPPMQRFCPACKQPVPADATQCPKCLWPL